MEPDVVFGGRPLLPVVVGGTEPDVILFGAPATAASADGSSSPCHRRLPRRP